MASRAPARPAARAAAPVSPPGEAVPVRVSSSWIVGGPSLRKIWELQDRLGKRYRGWAVDKDGMFAVDVLTTNDEEVRWDSPTVQRYTGQTLAEALDQAIVVARDGR
jgi:hypothetical protein